MFREITRHETTIILRESNRWGIYEYIKDKNFVIRENKTNKNEVFVIPLPLTDFIFFSQSFYGGLKMGILKKKKFIPSLHFFSIVAKFGNNFSYVIVDNKSEQLILYGKDIFGNSIIYASPDIDQNSTLLILNKSRDFLGIGRSKYQTDKIKSNGIVTVYTLSDLGEYLRFEK
ncbi:MAG TPA: PUA domain-containing protein [Nitrososphaeraceae archaeon]|nr:PUA domain-containing protein [Nitrososphaeraceae archaeon]